MTANSLRVIHVVPSIGRQSGGLTSAVVGLVAALQDQNVDVAINTTDAATPPQANEVRRGLTPSDLPDRFEELQIQVHPMAQPYRLSYAPGMLPALRSQLKDYDLLHIHGLFLYPQFAALRGAIATGTPYIVSTHGMLHPHFQQRGKIRKKVMDLLWQGRMLREASVLHATSRVEESALNALGYGPPIHVIPNGLSIGTYSAEASGASFRAAFGIASEVPIIVSHGRITAVKGLDLLIDALALIRKRWSDALLVIVGPDDEGLTETLRARAAALGVEKAVMFTGPLHGDRLRDAIDAADVWSLLSHSDSFGLAALEALAAGKAVVTSRYVDLAPEASDHDALVMVDTDADEAATEIIRLLGSKAARDQLGQRAKEYSVRFDWPNVAREFVRLYKRVLVASGKYAGT